MYVGEHRISKNEMRLMAELVFKGVLLIEFGVS